MKTVTGKYHFIRKSKDEILEKIIRFCWIDYQNTLQIAKELKSNWSTIIEASEYLANEGILERIKISNRIVGYRVKPLIKDTCFMICALSGEDQRKVEKILENDGKVNEEKKK